MSLHGLQWEASKTKRYGYGAGDAHPSVEHVLCPVCGAPPGKLCMGHNWEPTLERHYMRCRAYKETSKKNRTKERRKK